LDEYYFNGIPTPKNIQFKDISGISFNIMWDIDNIINIDKNKFKFKVEIKEKTEKKLEDFKEIYLRRK